jgi:hypothetical protein
MLRNFTPFETDSRWINGIGRPWTAVLGKENICIVTSVNGVSKKSTISDVLYAPSIGINLFAVGVFTAEWREVHFTKSRAFIERNGALEMTATWIDNKLYVPSRYHCFLRQWSIYCSSISEISSGLVLIHWSNQLQKNHGQKMANKKAVSVNFQLDLNPKPPCHDCATGTYLA